MDLISVKVINVFKVIVTLIAMQVFLRIGLNARKKRKLMMCRNK